MDLEGIYILSSEPDLRRVVRTILIADIVESLRLFERNEAETVNHWLAILKEILSTLRGRLNRVLGDGVLVEFDQVMTLLRPPSQSSRPVFGTTSADQLKAILRCV